jgi:hypothetical protein
VADSTVGGTKGDAAPTRTYDIISVDDHLCEPPDLFAGRVPAKFADRMPRIVEQPNGDQVWASSLTSR